MKKTLSIVFRIVVSVIVVFVLLLIMLFISEYKPKDVEPVEVTEGATRTVSAGDDITILTWNVGYGALGDNADFFMDGGSGVYTASKSRIEENLSGILEGIKENNADIVMLQEVDVNSMRTFGANEKNYFATNIDSADSSFGYNYRCLFVPYPIPPFGLINSGIMTLSNYEIEEANRYQLPCPFTWPTRAVNLKRCVVLNRLPIEGTDKELVIVNLHLEAYDSGEGKIEQTKLLKKILDAEADKGNYVIAGGDFNQSFSDVDFSNYPTYDGMWQPGIIDESDFAGWNLLMDESVPSCRSLDKAYEGADKENFQYYIIDGFIISENVEIKEFETVDYDFVNSDHNPVVVTVSLE